MTKTAVGLILGALTFAATCPNMAYSPARAEPLADVCTDADLQHHRSCEVGYLAMYIPHGSSSDCEKLYGREVTLHPQDDLLKPDFVAGCEAAKRERIEKGVAGGLDP